MVSRTHANPARSHNGVVLELYHETLVSLGIDPKTPPPYSGAQTLAIQKAKNYTLANADLSRRKREREAEPEASEAEFAAWKAEMMVIAEAEDQR